MKVLNTIQKNQFAALACIAVGVIATGCGSASSGGSMLTGISMKTTTDAAGDIFADASIHLDTGNLTLVSVDLPIINPQHPEKVYGRVALSSDIVNGGSQLDLQVNLSQFIHVGGTGAGCD